MPVKIQITARPELFRPQYGVEHASDFGTLVIDCRGVKVRDFNEAFRAHGMRKWPGIFLKLAAAQDTHVLDSFHRF